MTKQSRFFKWLKDNNKIELYSSMVTSYYNHGTIEKNRDTARRGILQIELMYSSYELSRITTKENVRRQINNAKHEDKLARGV